MNKSSDKHMNIFQAYSQQSEHPIENNLSRGFAILLQESPALFMKFIARLNAQGTKIPFPQGEYTIDFQRNAAGFELQAQTLVGVTLTATEFELGGNKNTTAKDKKYITDISVFFDDVLIFIEVKRTGENCEKQLEEQLSKYINTCKESLPTEEIDKNPPICSLTWTDVVSMLQENFRSFDGRVSRLESDYLDYLIRNYPQWAPVETLNKLNPSSECERISYRLERIKQNHVNDKDLSLVAARKGIPIDFPFATECNLGYTSDMLLPDGQRKPCVTISFWCADTCGQFWRFRDKAKRSFFEKRISSILVETSQTVLDIDILLYPYIKCSHFQRGVHWIYAENPSQKNDGFSIEDWFDYAESFTGRNKKDAFGNWKYPPETLAEHGAAFFSEENWTWFVNEFHRIFSTKSYADISFGIEVKAVIPFSTAQLIDREEKGFTKMLETYLQQIRSEIVKKR